MTEAFTDTLYSLAKTSSSVHQKAVFTAFLERDSKYLCQGLCYQKKVPSCPAPCDSIPPLPESSCSRSSYQRFLVSELKYRFPNTFRTARARVSRNLNGLAIKSPAKWQPAVAEKRAMYAGNGGPTKSDGYFLTPFMTKTMEMALPVLTKTFLPRSPDTPMLFAPSGCTHPPPPALSAVAEPISKRHCLKTHDEAEIIMTTFGVGQQFGNCMVGDVARDVVSTVWELHGGGCG